MIPKTLYQAIVEKNYSEIKKFAQELDDVILDHFPENCFQLILDLLELPSFLDLENSHNFLFVLLVNWEYLSNNQKNKLIPLLENSYELFKDWYSCFIISEIFGDKLHNKKVFEILCQLKNITSEMPRSFIPHAFEHIVIKTSEQNLKLSAFNKIREMKKDHSQKVRNEVDLSLRKIKNKGFNY